MKTRMAAMKTSPVFLLMGLFVFCTGEEQSGGGETCDDFTDLDLSHCILGTHLSVRLLLYTPSEPNCGRQLSHVHPASQFDLLRPIAFVIHGYRPTGAPPVWIRRVVNLLAEHKNMNVIVVDWNHGAANVNYFTAVSYTREAAHNLTGFLSAMEVGGASLSSVHLIGVSLGAHLAGFVGANLAGRIGRITGLDPAGPLFTGVGAEERLDATDAQFVDVLHTDMNSFGLRGVHGHVDFYANGGADQPGCPRTIFAGKSYFLCDHQRAVFLFLCALNQTCSLIGYPCMSYSHFLDGQCLQCDAFKPASCPQLGYNMDPWRHKLIEMKQTRLYFSTTDRVPYRMEGMSQKLEWIISS